MPNRQAVIDVLTQDVVGAQHFNGLTGQCLSMPTTSYQAVQDAAEAILERVARAVDWARLLREAAIRHDTLHPDRVLTDREWSPATGVCGECLIEALLADRVGATDWKQHPHSPREQDGTDWPGIVATNLPHRQAAHWHPYEEQPAGEGT